MKRRSFLAAIAAALSPLPTLPAEAGSVAAMRARAVGIARGHLERFLEVRLAGHVLPVERIVAAPREYVDARVVVRRAEP